MSEVRLDDDGLKPRTRYAKRRWKDNKYWEVLCVNDCRLLVVGLGLEKRDGKEAE